MSTATILSRLKRGPATAEELAEYCSEPTGRVARTMAGLITAGKARRIDGRKGRGYRATYALAIPKPKPSDMPAFTVRRGGETFRVLLLQLRQDAPA